MTESEPAWRSLLEDRDLVAEGQDLGFKFGPAFGGWTEWLRECHDAGAHIDAP